MPRSNVSAAMRDAVGCTLARQVSFPVSESDIRRWAIDRELGQMPPANRVLANPLQHLPPRWIVPVLVAGHDDTLGLVRGGGDVQTALGHGGKIAQLMQLHGAQA